MWDREKNSEDEPHLVDKDKGTKDTVVLVSEDYQYLHEPTINSVKNTTTTTADHQQRSTSNSQKNNPGKRRAKAQVEAIKGEDTITL